MTSSINIFDTIVRNMIEIMNPHQVLDIGPGEGKYYKILTDLESTLDHSIIKTCVEIDEEHVINRYSLCKKYDRVINCGAYELISKYPNLRGEIVIAGDLLEHMPKSNGRDLIEYLQYRYRHIVLIIPTDWPAFNYEDYMHEAHVSIWDSDDFIGIKNAYTVSKLSDSGKKFILAVVNSILINSSEHFVITDDGGVINYGFLNK